MKVLILDNYDSFTYNLVHLVEKILHKKPDVYRNDKIDLDEVNQYDRIILSPGPGLPLQAGLLIPIIKEYASSKPILGVCLGHQAIGEAFGGKLLNLSTVYHGVSNKIFIKTSDNNSLFRNMPGEIQVGRYHSWVIDKESFPSVLEVTAEDEMGNIMALQHKHYDIKGIQFHPESILTPQGDVIMRNWFNS